MSPALKYSLGRIGIFVVVAVPVVLLLPVDSVLVKLMVAILVSAALSFFLLRPWRDDLAAQIQTGASRRSQEKARLREALAGEDHQPGPPAVGPDRGQGSPEGGEGEQPGAGTPRLS